MKSENKEKIMTFDEKLTMENLQNDISSKEEFVRGLLEEVKENNHEVNEELPRDIKYVLTWRVNVSGITPERAQEYMDHIEQNLTTQLDKYNCLTFYIPVLQEETSLTVVNMETMKYVKI